MPTELEIIKRAIGRCKHCSERPGFNPDGYRGHPAWTVFHDCRTWPGTPDVVFTLAEWIKNHAD